MTPLVIQRSMPFRPLYTPWPNSSAWLSRTARSVAASSTARRHARTIYRFSIEPLDHERAALSTSSRHRIVAERPGG
jgi:hypothetical protein